MTTQEQGFLKHSCHELRAVKASLQAGFSHIRNPNIDREQAESLCTQGLNRLEIVLEKLEQQANESAGDTEEVSS